MTSCFLTRNRFAEVSVPAAPPAEVGFENLDLWNATKDGTRPITGAVIMEFPVPSAGLRDMAAQLAA